MNTRLPTPLPTRARRLARWLPALAWMAFITYWSGRSDLPIDSPRTDQLLRGLQHPLAHAVAFAVLALLAYWALRPGWRAALWSVALVAIFGAVDEWHQSFTPGRAPETQDWLVDVSAAFVSVVLVEVARLRPAWVVPQPAVRLAPIRASLTMALAATLVLGTLAVASPAAPSGTALAKRSLHAAGRLVPDSVERRAIRLADRAVDAARAARAELRDQLRG